MARKKKLEQLHQADAVIHNRNPKVTLKTLDTIMGGSFSKYKTTDAAVYEKYLKDLNKVDLQKEACTIGLMPIDDRLVLEERLLKEFDKFQCAVASKDVKHIALKTTKNLLDLLSEGAN